MSADFMPVPERGVIHPTDPSKTLCVACGQPYGTFKSDPFTRKLIHEECIVARHPLQMDHGKLIPKVDD